MGGEALEQHRRGVLEADRVRQRYRPFGRRQRVGRIAAGGEHEGDAVATGEVADIGTDGFDNAPTAFMGLLQGKNFGKALVRVSE